MERQFLNQQQTENYSFSFGELKVDDFDRLRKRSSELLNKFRTAWNEAEYQEWCAIQRILHKIR
ncbi:hypothetical protein BC792_103204 [Sphingobacterium allocomposti]|uniref:Uncharacterized protein n=1 Tax=Sphingobacterium allocomposti TaxID=415956 RepID=A0A5S5DMY3_9SPHI|nr:hypothetical protein [Sphingobacterium composti Yoo et al. 2007 non Ten et al. 2007]TYP97277.1 hypothetical protein BC792_103204 [Sphingobacterium composti Yoo et al. 2007 non Ten et al. 2007]HLS96837.1 hypothetical protein [Sphingobacterium sp.]